MSGRRSKADCKLMRSILKGDLDAARQSLDDGADIDQGKPDRRPFIVSIEHGHVDIARLLLDRGAAMERTRLERMMVCVVLEYPFLQGESSRQLIHPLEMTRLLLDAGARADEIEPKQGTPLCIASSRGLLGVADLLLARGAAVDGPDPNNSPLWRNGQVGPEREHSCHQMAELLLDRGANVDGHPESGAIHLHGTSPRFTIGGALIRPHPLGGCRTPLYEAIICDQLSYARLLIDRGADELRLCLHRAHHLHWSTGVDDVYNTPLGLARQKGGAAAALFDPLPPPPRARMLRHLRWRFLFHANAPGARDAVFTDKYLSAHLAEFLMEGPGAWPALWNLACDAPAAAFVGQGLGMARARFAYSHQDNESDPDEAP